MLQWCCAQASSDTNNTSCAVSNLVCLYDASDDFARDDARCRLAAGLTRVRERIPSPQYAAWILSSAWAVTPLTADGAIEDLLLLLQARRSENMRPLPEPALLQPRLPAERLEEAQGDLRAARAAAAAADEPVGRGRLPARCDEGPRHEEHGRVQGRSKE